jgi:hypothetical protein
MSRIHVFAIDWVPAGSDIASGGGLRSLQIIEALRDFGHEVSWSVPANSRHVRRVGRDSAELRHVELHDEGNQLDILKRRRPEVVFWLPTLIRNVPLLKAEGMANVCDLIGLPHYEAAMGAPGSVRPMANRLLGLCTGADLVLTGSDEQNGYWQSELERRGLAVPAAIVPYALPRSLTRPPPVGRSRLQTLHVTGMIYAWSTSVQLLVRVAEWVSHRNDIRLSLIAGTDPGGATDRSELQELHAATSRLGLEVSRETAFDRAMAEYQPGSISLDLYQDTPERRMAVPIRTVNALTHAVPILSTIDGAFTRRLQRAGAAMIADGKAGRSLEEALDHLAALSAADFGRMADAAKHFASQEFSAEAASDALRTAVEEALDRRAVKRRSWHSKLPNTPRSGQVLVLSNEGDNLQDLRIRVPFAALHARGQIAGYSIWSRGKFSFSTSANPTALAFDAIWAQRHTDPEVSIALSAMRRPFVYDLDDNLLTSPAYRERFSLESVQTVRHMIRACTVLSCSTTRLAQLVQKAVAEFVIDKAIITPNLLREQIGPRKTGVPQAVVWCSTDTPALTQSRIPVLKAIRDFCLAYELKLVCIGAAPADLLIESGVEIEHIAAMPYGEYLFFLRSLAPAILFCPLETHADPATQDFVNGKSDIKILEALATGLIGVFSRASPYQDTDLPTSILCENNYKAWFEGLMSAWHLSTRTDALRTVPDSRVAGSLGTEPWREALGRATMTEPLSYQDFASALMLLRGRLGRRLLSQPEFDHEFYLTRYPDVQRGVAEGKLYSPYTHYRDHGFIEGRLGRPDDLTGSHNQQFWANLMHTIGDLRATVDARSLQIDALRARRVTRMSLRRHN